MVSIEKRTLIEPKDILGLEYECMHCGLRYLIQSAKLDRPIETCPNCRESWLSDQQTADKKAPDSNVVQVFIDSLRDLQHRTLGARLRFHIQED